MRAQDPTEPADVDDEAEEDDGDDEDLDENDFDEDDEILEL